MSLIPKVKCGRCDRSYSGLKNKCPHCGAGRSRSGKRASDWGDGPARRMIKALLLLTLVITTVSLAFLDLSVDPAEVTPGGPGTVQGPSTGEDEENGDEDEEGPSLPFIPPQPTPPPVQVTSIDIQWRGKGRYNDMTIPPGRTLELWSEIFPTDADADINWTVDNNAIALITVQEDHSRVYLEARSVGQTIVRVTAGEESAQVIIRVRA